MHRDPCTEEFLLPQVEALLAGTLALMTGLSQDNGQCAHRALMQAKVRANLTELVAHPQVSDSLRKVLTRLLAHWAAGPAAPAQDMAQAHAPTRPALLH